MTGKNIVVTCGESRTGDAVAHLFLDRKDFKEKIKSVKVTFPPDLDNPELSKVGAQLIQVPKGDYASIPADELAEKFRGADVVVLIPPAATNKVAQAMRAMEAVKKAEVKNVILISSQGCTSGKKYLSEFFEIEQTMHKMMPDANICVLRSGHYMQNLFLYAKQMMEDGVLTLPTGKGKFAPIDARDVGLCAVTVALSGTSEKIAEQFAGQTFTLTGLELVSGEDIIAVANRAIKRSAGPMEFKAVSEGEWEKTIKTLISDMDPSEIRVLAEEFELVAQDAFAKVSMDVQRICPNEKPTKLQEFLKEYADEVFKPTQMEE